MIAPTPRRWFRLAFSLRTLFVVVTLAAIVAWQYYSNPLEQEFLAADRIEIIGTAGALDGGSRVFFLRLNGRLIELVFHHRDTKMGGNPSYQSIYVIDHDRGAIVREHSVFERKLVALLRDANVSLDAELPAVEVTPEQLKWGIDRIQDRKSGW